jgi:endonuclease/exonuclease/phosphatase family metal-dependent hydrolase
MNKLTLGTLNLNSQKLNAKKFADIVLESNIDIICFNECGKSLAERLQSLLAPYGFSHVFAPADYCGNALFSRFPIKRHHTSKLFASQSEGRSAVAITVDLPLHDIEETGVSHQEVSFVATHLCHYDEDARIEQFDILRRKVCS